LGYGSNGSRRGTLSGCVLGLHLFTQFLNCLLERFDASEQLIDPV
jgi:hypothetical protein